MLSKDKLHREGQVPICVDADGVMMAPNVQITSLDDVQRQFDACMRKSVHEFFHSCKLILIAKSKVDAHSRPEA